MKENVIRAALVLEDYGKSGEGDWWRDKDEMPLGYALWRWRTEALHDSWSTIDVSNEFTVRNFCMELGFDEEAVRNVFAEPNPLQVLRDSISKPAGATMGVDS